ncbi:hypothetical protein FVE85_4343 [Porphyridium purpureum]|uniref:CCHC-type domain-containing protein n=1 Tax=Porphyridium purpureum TaxID=35688 RepID=A0A5J4YI62_PORPP|nr:hypothetical protein FVE85_4343 [Porphyridium purpureum]|eukprot:POR1955..scf270_19
MEHQEGGMEHSHANGRGMEDGPSAEEHFIQQMRAEMEAQLHATLAAERARIEQEFAHRLGQLEQQYARSVSVNAVAPGASDSPRAASRAVRVAKMMPYEGRRDVPTILVWQNAARTRVYNPLTQEVAVARRAWTSADERHAIEVASTYLAGNAMLWWISLEVRPVQFDEFLGAVHSNFAPANAAKQARDELAACVQGTRDVREYETAFSQICLRIAGLSEEEKLDRFLRGLSKRVRVFVEMSEPSTFNGAVEKATNVDEVLNRDGRQQAYRAPATSQSGPAPMELGSAEWAEEQPVTERRPSRAAGKGRGRQMRKHGRGKGGGKRATRGEQDKTASKESGGPRCYRCKRRGHIARECRNSTAAYVTVDVIRSTPVT